MKMTSGRDKQGRIRIGFWCSEREPDLPNPKDFVDKDWDAAVLDKVVRYLTRSQFTGPSYKGYSTCRICGCRNGSADMSDGVYVWPSGFQHYLLAHNVKPTSKFLRHVLDRVEAIAPKPITKPVRRKSKVKQNPAVFDDHCPVCREAIGWDVLVGLYDGKSFRDAVSMERQVLECPHCECTLHVDADVFFGLRQAPFE